MNHQENKEAKIFHINGNLEGILEEETDVSALNSCFSYLNGINELLDAYFVDEEKNDN